MQRSLDRGHKRRTRARVDEPVRPTATRHQAALQVSTKLQLHLTSQPRIDAGVQQRQHQVGGLATLAYLERLHAEQQRVQESQLRQPRQRSLLERDAQLRERATAATQQHRAVLARVVSATPLQNGTEALANRHAARTLADTLAQIAHARGAEDGPTPQRQAQLVRVRHAHARPRRALSERPASPPGSQSSFIPPPLPTSEGCPKGRLVQTRGRVITGDIPGASDRSCCPGGVERAGRFAKRLDSKRLINHNTITR